MITWCVDGLFIVDMLLQFVTMYPKTTARGLEWECRPRKIARHYVTTWFFLESRDDLAYHTGSPEDFVTLIPLDTIGLLSDADSRPQPTVPY